MTSFVEWDDGDSVVFSLNSLWPKPESGSVEDEGFLLETPYLEIRQSRSPSPGSLFLHWQPLERVKRFGHRASLCWVLSAAALTVNNNNLGRAGQWTSLVPNRPLALTLRDFVTLSRDDLCRKSTTHCNIKKKKKKKPCRWLFVFVLQQENLLPFPYHSFQSPWSPMNLFFASDSPGQT